MKITARQNKQAQHRCSQKELLDPDLLIEHKFITPKYQKPQTTPFLLDHRNIHSGVAAIAESSNGYLS